MQETSVEGRAVRALLAEVANDREAEWSWRHPRKEMSKTTYISREREQGKQQMRKEGSVFLTRDRLMLSQHRQRCKCGPSPEPTPQLIPPPIEMSRMLKKINIWSGLEEEHQYWGSRCNALAPETNPEAMLQHKSVLLHRLLSNADHMQQFKQQTFLKVRNSLKDAESSLIHQKFRETFLKYEKSNHGESQKNLEGTGKIRMLLRSMVQIRAKYSSKDKKEIGYHSNLLKQQLSVKKRINVQITKKQSKIINLNQQAEKMHIHAKKCNWRRTNLNKSNHL